jgi:phosphoglycerol transferase MdoB-like AlkP superfamily enzyme
MEQPRKVLRAVASMVGYGVFALVLLRVCDTEVDPLERIYCVSLAFALALFVAVASGRFAFGFLCSGALAGAIWLASSLKVAYLHEPLLAPDMHYLLGTLATEVIAHYPKMMFKVVAVIVALPLLAVFVWRQESPGIWLRRSVFVRGGITFVALLVLLCLAWPRGPFRSVYAMDTWDFIEHVKRNPMTTFLRSLARMQVSIPVHAANAHEFNWDEPAANVQATRRPDIVTVLEESTLDPRQWSACTSERCRFDMFEADERTRASGLLKVHTYGGGTWTSEFALLAGLPHSLFGPAGIYAPYNLVPRMRETLPRQLKALGYRTIAVYPMPRDFVRAADAYAEYGFDEFHDAHELRIEWETSDLELVERVKQIHRHARSEDDRPLFLMVLTMRQHGPHDKPLDALPPPWNEPPAPALGARVNRNLGTYLYRMHQSDQALTELRRYLFGAGRGAVLAHFGDHHPSFDGVESTLGTTLPAEYATEASELTYFRIDSNLEDTAPLRVPQRLDLAFLGGLVLDVAGLPKNAYFEANTLLRDRCDGRFDDCPQRPLLDSYFGYAFDTLHAFD